METRIVYLRVRAGILLYLILAAISLTHCDADRSMRRLRSHKHKRILINKDPKKLKMIKHFDLNPTLDSSNIQPYSVGSPFALPPYESLAPIPENNPPFCVYPSPSTPSTSIPTPTGYQFSPPSPYYYTSPVVPTQVPPPSPTSIIPGPPGFLPTPTPEIVRGPPSPMPSSPEPISNPPIIFPSPPYFEPSPPSIISSPTPEIVSGPPSQMPSSPEPISNPPVIFPSPPYFESSPPSIIPSPTPEIVSGPPSQMPSSPEPILNPPIIFPGPPYFEPSPPSITPSPTGSIVPSPTVFQPPVVNPPPSVPPPPNTAPIVALWCVAKASVPEPIIQEAMNYACLSGADCISIQPNGPCFEPNSVFAHASYAFNSLWQRTRAAGGTCEFGGTAILVTVDPSYEGCHFVY